LTLSEKGIEDDGHCDALTARLLDEASTEYGRPHRTQAVGIETHGREMEDVHTLCPYAPYAPYAPYPLGVATYPVSVEDN